ncbi:MAG: alpha-amylase/4-alpha-glucanotransferase domain-containing protein, partial [Candidatus Methylacidiphilales bacterium]
DEARIRFYETKRELETRHDSARFLPFFRAGSWENFRQRFSESNLMQKKGLWLRKKLWQAGSADPVVRDWLWQAQCNTAYWHGTSGGIYSPNLREAVWERLLSAQRRLQLANGNWKMERVDFDGDGVEEILCFNDCCSVGIGMAHGGGLFEWSTLPALHNYSNTLTRRRETAPQHLPHAGIETRDSGVHGDLHERRSFLDRILDRHVTVSQLTSGKLPDRARFIFENYRLIRFGVEDGTAEVVNEAVGLVEQGGHQHALRIRKTFRLPPGGHTLLCSVELTNESGVELDGVFASELNLSLSPHQEEIVLSVAGRPTRTLHEAYYGETVSSVTLSDRKFHLGMSLEADKPFLLWACPLTTRSPDSKSPPIVQGHLITTGWPFRLTAGTAAIFDFRVSTPNVFHKMID